MLLQIQVVVTTHPDYLGELLQHRVNCYNRIMVRFMAELHKFYPCMLFAYASE